MKVYNKLVRDKIPEIINANGSSCQTRVLDNEEYLHELNKKLLEEVKEYDESKLIEELADIEEVLHALVLAKGYSMEDFNALKENKRLARGGFEDKIFLISTND